MEEKKILQNEEELEKVAGGDKAENAQIIALFRKYGFEKQARTLEKAHTIWFGHRLEEMMKELSGQSTVYLKVVCRDGYPNKKELYSRSVNQREVMEYLDGFLANIANGK